jgi:hypothetical protein
MDLCAPCCERTIAVTLEEIDIVDLAATDPDLGSPSWGFNSRCCQTLYNSKEELLSPFEFGSPVTVAEILNNERRAVIQATKRRALRAAREEYEQLLRRVQEQIDDLEAEADRLNGTTAGQAPGKEPDHDVE